MRPAYGLVLTTTALLLAGCSGVSVEGLTSGEAPREPHFEEHRGLVAPQHDAEYPVQVDAGARSINVTLSLVQRGASVIPTVPPLPPVPPVSAPARLTVELVDAKGDAVSGAVADLTRPDVALLVREPLEPGEWTVRVRGSGGSASLEGQDVGASYLLTMEVLYA